MQRLIDFLPISRKNPFLDPIIKVIAGVALISLFAPIEFHFSQDIPITLQSLLVLVVPMIIGPVWGSLAVLTYLILGFAGLPVFANGSSGLEKLWGPTGGFLLGFLIAAPVVGKMAEGRWGLNWMNIALTLLTGHVLILLTGFTCLGYQTNFEGITAKVLPLLPGLYVKILIGSAFMILANSLMKFFIRKRYGTPPS